MLQRNRQKQAPIVLRNRSSPTKPFPVISLQALPFLETRRAVVSPPPPPAPPSPPPSPQPFHSNPPLSAMDMMVMNVTLPAFEPSSIYRPISPPPPPPLVLPDPVPGFCTVTCPHCLGCVIIHPSERNCAIFRHGTFRANGQPIPPHAPKAQIDIWLRANQIYGCGGPFKLTSDTTAEACDYI
jgi:hypothetical protein